LAAVLGLIVGTFGAARPANAGDAIVHPNQREQVIDGFGASSAWTAPDMGDAGADLTFSTDPAVGGAGLSLLRVRIAPDGTCGEIATAQEAIARGATVWATPWSPPPEWKTGTDDAGNGGSLLPMYYGAWANRLVSAVQSLQAQGVHLVGLSAQNEPTTPASYESCLYTPTELVDFVGQYLAPALSNAGLLGVPIDTGAIDTGAIDTGAIDTGAIDTGAIDAGAIDAGAIDAGALDTGAIDAGAIDAGAIDAGGALKIIAPETQDWTTFAQFEGAIWADDAGRNAVGILASHSYAETSPSPVPAVAQAGKSLWETEVSDPAADPGILSGLWVASSIHQALVSANANAWHYWWIYPQGPGNGALYDPAPTGSGNPVPTKRLYAMGNFSRFVRPGFFRVNATENPQPCAPVEVSAYTDQQSANLVIVAINSGTVPFAQGFVFDGVTTGSWTSFVTSSSQNLEDGGEVSNGGLDGGPDGSRIVFMLAPQSVTTLVGHVTGVGQPAAEDGASALSIACGDAAPAGPAPSCGLACSTATTRASGRDPAKGSTIAAIAAMAASIGRRRVRRSRRKGSSPRR
jgi:O-glycosyl hydrolase